MLYLAALREVRVRGAYYGLLRPANPSASQQGESQSEPAPPVVAPASPFLDLRPLLELPRWLHALETLRETRSTVPLAKAVRAGPSSQTVKKVSVDLTRLAEAYLSALPLELGHQAHLFREHSIKPLRKLLRNAHDLPQAGELGDHIAGIVESFALSNPASGSGWKRKVALSEAELQRQASIIDDLWAHGNVAAALGLMNEWTVSWVVWRRGRAHDWLDFSTARRGAGNFLDAVAAVGSDADTEFREALTEEQREIGAFWAELREVRNAYAHHGMRPQVVVGDQKVEKQRKRVRDFWARLRSSPNFSLTLGPAPGRHVLVSRSGAGLACSSAPCRPVGQAVTQPAPTCASLSVRTRPQHPSTKPQSKLVTRVR